MARGQAFGLPCSVLNTPAEFVADEQLVARDFFVTVHDDALGEVRMPGRAVRVVDLDAPARRSCRARAAAGPATPRPSGSSHAPRPPRSRPRAGGSGSSECGC